MDIELIINSFDEPTLESLKSVVASLRQQDHVVCPRVTFDADDASRFALEATRRGADLVLAAGGDGTVNHVANGILEAAGSRPPEELPRLGIVPLGTGNDLAGFLSLPEEIEAAVWQAVTGPAMVVDAATLNGRSFMNVSSAGLGAEATDEASDLVKRMLGSVAYFVTGARKFATLRPSSARFLSNEDVLYEGDFLFFAVGNGGRAGGGNWIAPDADMADGFLDLCIVGAMSRSDFLRLLPDLRAGTHVSNEHVIYRQLKDLTVEPTSELTVNVDGETIDFETLRYSIRPRAIRLAGVDRSTAPSNEAGS